VEDLLQQATEAEVATRAAAEAATIGRAGLEAARQAAAGMEAALDVRESKLRDSWHALRAQLADLAGDKMLALPHSDTSLAVRPSRPRACIQGSGSGLGCHFLGCELVIC